jgi:transcriptional regulator with XRE-family HTH domain
MGDKDRIGARVARLRKARGLTQIGLALSRALMLVTHGEYRPALAVAGGVLGTAEAPGIDGALHLRCAISAARAGNSAVAWEHLGTAQELAVTVTGADTYALAFNPANVEVHGVAVAVELGDYDEAIRRGGGLMLPAPACCRLPGFPPKA